MTVYFSIVIFIFGVIMGSFYNVLATRLPIGKSIIKPGSHCDACNHELKWYENIPLISYIIQKGKCKNCGEQIPFDVFLSELATGVLFLFSYLYFGISYNFFIMLILSSLCVIIFVSDFKYMIILDSPLIIAGVLVIILKTVYYGYKTIIPTLISGIITFLVMLLVGFIG